MRSAYRTMVNPLFSSYNMLVDLGRTSHVVTYHLDEDDDDGLVNSNNISYSKEVYYYNDDATNRRLGPNICSLYQVSILSKLLSISK
jgi:hypothetical protein